MELDDQCRGQLAPKLSGGLELRGFGLGDPRFPRLAWRGRTQRRAKHEQNRRHEAVPDVLNGGAAFRHLEAAYYLQQSGAYPITQPLSVKSFCHELGNLLIKDKPDPFWQIRTGLYLFVVTRFLSQNRFSCLRGDVP
jgi:hypothetical protein